MNILIIGSGGREHSLAWKIKQSPLCEQLYICPGNAGTWNVGTNLDLPHKAWNEEAFAHIGQLVNDNNIGMVIVGPEEPLVKGIKDYFLADPSLKNIPLVGPTQSGAQLEGSKNFAKTFMLKYGIPTARARGFSLETLEDGLKYLATLPMPVVLKADGLAAGKGVIICYELKEAQNTLEDMLAKKKFGAAGERVIIEEFLKGIELSVFILTDGSQYKLLPEAKDYKRVGENDTGPNTGGMGAISPVPFADKTFMKKVDEKIIKPTLEGIKNENLEYQGFLFLGLMNVEGDPYVIEYNVRLGDPEAEAIIPRIEDDIVPSLMATTEKKLDNKPFKIAKNTASTVVMVSGGYPGQYEKGKSIHGLDEPGKAQVFHAGTKLNEGVVQTNGGRVLAITGTGKNIKGALKTCYDSIDHITWEGAQYRKDIGYDLVQKK